MNAAVQASRAVLTAYAKKTLRPVEITAVIVFAVALFGTASLIVNVSPWWWLLMIIVGAYGAIGSIMWLVIHYTLDRLTPPQTKTQSQAVHAFIVRAEKVADLAGMTRFGLLLRVIQNVLSRSETNVLSDLAQSSKDLKKSFEEVIAAFR